MTLRFPIYLLMLALLSGRLYAQATVSNSPAEKLQPGQMPRSTICYITERKRAEEALRQSEEQARQLAQENTILAEIGRIISSTLNISEVYGLFAEQVQKAYLL